MSTAHRIVGLDFGTTNSALAILENGQPRLASFTAPGQGTKKTFRSVLFFDEEERDSRGRPLATAGPEAIHRYLDAGSGRFIQSTKTYLASDLFDATSIFSRRFTLDQLVGLIVCGVREQAERQFGDLGRRVVVGRPVRYARSRAPEDEARALTRMRRALEMAGFDEVDFEYEPVAAAYAYEQSLDHDELVLIADFGGGTSDFTLAHVGPSRRQRGQDILATEGVAIAGDSFDSRMVREVIAPALGLGSTYRAGLRRKLQTIPASIYGKLRKWHHLSFLKSPATRRALDQFRHQATEPEKIEALIHVVEEDLGFRMYQSVEATKTALSKRTRDRLRFDVDISSIERDVERSDFERWIEPDLSKISRCVDQTLSNAGVSSGDVDRVFMTGGSSLVPAVRSIFASRFGDARVLGGEALTTVASGLALRARE